MLYSPKWNLYSLDSLIAWLETKNPRKRYDFCNCNDGKDGCLLSQYLGHHSEELGESGSAYSQISDCGGREVAIPCPWTFGAALKRALALRDSRK